MKSFLHSFGFALHGIAAGSCGRNFRVMLAAALAVAGTAWWLRVPATSVALLVLCLGLVLALELVNTAGEKLIDILCPTHDDRYGRVKDVLAGAVLVAALAAAVAGLLVLGPPLWTALKSLGT
jgi:diacylglycerol kinase